MFARTGEAKAHPEGAFAKNRDQAAPQKVQSYVIEDLGFLLNDGVRLEQISGEAGSITLTAAPKTTGKVEDHSDDSNGIRDWGKAQVTTWREHFFPHAVAVPKEPVKGRGDYAALTSLKRTAYRKEKGPEFKNSFPHHFICTLADVQKDVYYALEESLTSRGIYFTKAEFAENGYKEYAKHLGGEAIVILRVNRDKLLNPHDDPSEGKAIRSEGKVQFGDIEVFVDHKRFLEKEEGVAPKNIRDIDGNWIALGVWTPR
jgi:hypothetical protein